MDTKINTNMKTDSKTDEKPSTNTDAKKIGIATRLIFLIVGTSCISFGIAFFSKAAIGMAPISSFPYVLSKLITSLTLGNWVLIWNALFAVLQIPLEGRNYKLYLLTQIPLAALLGYVTDFAKWIISPISLGNYILQLLFAFVGLIITAMGIVLTVRADLVLNGPEAFLHSLSGKTGVRFGTLKIFFDGFCAVLAILTSLIFLHHIDGIREGTIIAVVLTGYAVNVINRIINSFEKE